VNPTLLKVLLSLVAAVVLAVLAVWTASDEVARPPPIMAETEEESDVEPGAPGASRPRSLRDTEVDGELVADAEGRFLPTRDALRLFEYFLSAYGEEAEDLILERIELEIRRRLSPAAAPDARALLAQYQRYRDAARELEVGPEPDQVDALEARLAQLRELRREVFGPELAATLFAEDELIAEVAIERRRVLDDPSLGDRERITRLAEVQARLPEAVRQAELEAMAPLRLHQEEAAARAAGASEGEIQGLRERAVGAEAAGRLSELDRERAEWDRRMEVYRLERDRVIENVREAPDDIRGEYLRQLRERHFKPEELARVEALDRIELRERVREALPPPPLE
jgi:lipase chaperone LimK